MLKQVAAAAFFAALVVAQDFIINTPSGVTACQPTLLTWTGGVPPYFLDILDGDNLAGGTVENLLTSSDATQYTWKVNLDPGFSAVAQIRDSTGLTKTTAPFPINAGSDKSCLGGSSSSTSGSSSSTASTTSGSSASSSKPASSSTGSSTVSTPTSTTATTPATSSTPATSTTASSTPATSTTPASSTPASSTTPGTSSAASTPSGAALGQTIPVAGVIAALAAVFFA